MKLSLNPWERRDYRSLFFRMWQAWSSILQVGKAFHVFRGEVVKNCFYLWCRVQEKQCEQVAAVKFHPWGGKMAIYLTSRNKRESGVSQDLVSAFVSLVRARVWIDFKFYKQMNTLDSFALNWCLKDIICSVEEETLFFGLFICDFVPYLCSSEALWRHGMQHRMHAHTHVLCVHYRTAYDHIRVEV